MPNGAFAGSANRWGFLMRDVKAQLASYQDHLDSVYPAVTPEEVREVDRQRRQVTVVSLPLRRRLIAFALAFAAIVGLGILGIVLGGDGSGDTVGRGPTISIADPTVPPSPTVTSTPVEPAAEPVRVLFVGNSISMWNDGVDNALRRLAASADPPHTIEADSLIRLSEPSHSLYEVLLASSLEVLWSVEGVQEVIADGDWDVVVLQEELGPRSASVESFHESVRKFDTEIRAAGARTVLFMHHPFEAFGVELNSIEEIARAHWEIAGELDLEVAPVGLAWELVAAERPDLDLYDVGRGPNPNFHGTYLAANVIYNTIFGEALDSPTYLLPDMTDEEGAFLRDIARQAVQESAGP